MSQLRTDGQDRSSVPAAAVRYPPEALISRRTFKARVCKPNKKRGWRLRGRHPHLQVPEPLGHCLIDPRMPAASWVRWGEGLTPSSAVSLALKFSNVFTARARFPCLSSARIRSPTQLS